MAGTKQLPYFSPPKSTTDEMFYLWKVPISKGVKESFCDFFPRFPGSDALIQSMSTTKHSLLNQTFWRSIVALQISDSFPGEYQENHQIVFEDFTAKNFANVLQHFKARKSFYLDYLPVANTLCWF